MTGTLIDSWPADWWHGATMYQVYVRSFADSDGDGVGDLEGLIDRLDHLSWLGVRGLWLSPTTPSPDRDWGYDVSDYRSVHPDLGDLETFDRLVREAARRRIGILLDLVPNHTSDLHPWFLDARSSRDAAKRDYYVWVDSRADGSPPNNWQSVFGGPAWTLDDPTGQWYLHNFLPEQPDLNWWDERVRDEFDGILRFWLERGVAGFRIDVAHAMVKDRLLRDNPPTTEEDHPIVRRLPLREVHNMNQPEVHDVIRRWRRVVDSFGPGRLLVGETWVFGVERLVPFYGTGRDELDLGFNFPFAFSAFDADELGTVVEATEAALPAGSWPVWMGSNHDIGRLATRWGGGRRGAHSVRAGAAAVAPRDGVPLLRRRDRDGRRAGAAESAAGPGRHPRVAGPARAGRVPDADAMERAGRAPGSPIRTSSPGSRSAMPPSATSRRRNATRTRSSTSHGSSSGCDRRPTSAPERSGRSPGRVAFGSGSGAP